jgi:hypothetical protein
MEDFSTEVLSHLIVPEWCEPELAPLTTAALRFVKHATRRDAVRRDLVLRQKVSPQFLRGCLREVSDVGL